MTTYNTWEAECLRIKKELATARKRKTLCKGPLSEKIDRAREVRQLEEDLRQHKLNYFSYSKPEL